MLTGCSGSVETPATTSGSYYSHLLFDFIHTSSYHFRPFGHSPPWGIVCAPVAGSGRSRAVLTSQLTGKDAQTSRSVRELDLSELFTPTFIPATHQTREYRSHSRQGFRFEAMPRSRPLSLSQVVGWMEWARRPLMYDDPRNGEATALLGAAPQVDFRRVCVTDHLRSRDMRGVNNSHPHPHPFSLPATLFGRARPCSCD